MREGQAKGFYPEGEIPREQKQEAVHEKKELVLKEFQRKREELFLKAYARKVAEFLKGSVVKYGDFTPVVSLIKAVIESQRGISADGRILSPFERMRMLELAASTAFYYISFPGGDSLEHAAAGLYSAGLTASVAVETFAKQVWPELHKKAKAWAGVERDTNADLEVLKDLLSNLKKFKKS